MVCNQQVARAQQMFKDYTAVENLHAQHGFHALGQPPTPSGFHALLGFSPSRPQGRPGELPLFLLVAAAPVAIPGSPP